MMWRKKFSLIAAVMLAASAFVPAGLEANQVFAAEKSKRVVVLSDVHYGSKEHKDKALRQKLMQNKEKAVQDINSWNDVDLCVFTGDMTELAASEDEYKLAHSLTDKVTHPKIFLAGNHEVVYSEVPAVKGKNQPAGPFERVQHIDRYIKNYGPLYQAKELGGYLLLTLSPDVIEGHIPSTKPYAVELSKAQLTWLKAELKANQDKPTIIFCHTPLKGTILPDNSENEERNFTYPDHDIKDILVKNPQVLIWTSGHTHTPPTDPSFDNPINKVPGTNVLDVYNPAWEGDQVWTNSFYLYPDRIVVRTYSHKDHKWLTQFDRTIQVPSSLRAAASKAA
ncbi:MAG: metallophosphoesterase [Acidaminococcus sp.]|jgi:3',5'-cyclic AMP phosphodiesterase CpdA|nr:metallophosphoesterase [Acidaminococcus sp.]MCI2100384.1 metallophosphoesterase [Acidaminococcus sp.]MCI2114705.1 metallophosphoesterase [Acidaminococcus sp.]MCI2116720.1 metallophosphoesterase [Acidaminococcus sp.]